MHIATAWRSNPNSACSRSLLLDGRREYGYYRGVYRWGFIVKRWCMERVGCAGQWVAPAVAGLADGFGGF